MYQILASDNHVKAYVILLDPLTIYLCRCVATRIHPLQPPHRPVSISICITGNTNPLKMVRRVVIIVANCLLFAGRNAYLPAVIAVAMIVGKYKGNPRRRTFSYLELRR